MKILVAEDDLRLARAVKRVFEEESHAVKIVGNGRNALDAARHDTYDVLILDVMLPEMDGFEVCRQMRSAGTDMPVLMLTARTDITDRVKGLDAGADDYMVKPFAVAELLARVRALGRRGARAATGNGHLRAGDLVLDISKHSAIRNGQEIELTVKEFQLLELMLRHQGQVLTRAQILDHVWQYDRDFSSNVVDIYVHYLRNKVDRGFKTQLIRTVRGVGYTLKA
ncbi:MAG: response regulator transcription factor [Dehalococcoidia bacterium]